MKVCSKCNLEKEYSEFARDNSRVDGYSYICKTCKKKDYIDKRSDILEKKAQYYIENKSKILPRCCEYGRTWRFNNKDKVNVYNARKRLRRLNRSKTYDPRIETMYSIAKRLTSCLGIEFQVDHIIPLQGRKVSGLHVYNNLQVITATQNYKKGNKYHG